MLQTHIWQEASVEANGSVTVSAKIELPKKSLRLWYSIPVEFSTLLTDSCDPFLVAMMLPAMRHSAPLIVHGKVSPSLLQNLVEFQAAWACWRPNEYYPIEISAEVEEEIPIIASEVAVAAFSGGVDSCFTAFRHRENRCGRQARNLQAGLMVHGFDIPLEESLVFDRAAEKSRLILDSLGMKLIPIATNYRQVLPSINWLDAYGPAIASSLMLLSRSYNVGLIGSAFSYHNLLLPRGSNPVTDPFLSSKAFQIIHDGAGFDRLGKIKEIGHWQEATQHLRVCWQGAQKDRNCGRCEKCIRTILGFRALGLSKPACFDQDVTDEQIIGIKGLTAIQLYEMELILQAVKGSVTDSWVNALEKCITRNRRQMVREQNWTTLKQSLPPTLLKQWRSLQLRLSSQSRYKD
ncbi:MAG: hypothetical protein KME06_06310 [Kastovskya adunca ATA6-11-RM4]|jgi:hypothetical protein|nr:hypothetical protein [Kastovskya adunca ATA6-11-RM4]